MLHHVCAHRVLCPNAWNTRKETPARHKEEQLAATPYDTYFANILPIIGLAQRHLTSYCLFTFVGH